MFLKTSTAQILQVVVISVGDSLFRKTFKSLAFNNKKSCQKFNSTLLSASLCDYSNESSRWVHSNGTVCVITKES